MSPELWKETQMCFFHAVSIYACMTEVYSSPLQTGRLQENTSLNTYMQFQLSTQCMFSHEGHPLLLKNSLVYPALNYNYLKQEKYFYGYSVHRKPGDVKSVIIMQSVLAHFQQTRLDCHSIFVLNADPFILLEMVLKK